MTTLLFVLAPIALLDSTSMIPLSIVPIALILSNRNLIGGAIGFLFGVLLVYFATGLLLLFGLDALLERIEPALLRWWNNPDSSELLLQLIVGIFMLLFAWKIGSSQGKPKKQAIKSNLSPSHWFMFGTALTLGGMPGAIPLLGAIDQIIRAELSNKFSIAALIFYILVFITPLLILFLVPRLFPSQSETIFTKLSHFFEIYGPLVLAVVLALLGLVFAIDAVGFYFGHPLLPVGESAIVP